MKMFRKKKQTHNRKKITKVKKEMHKNKTTELTGTTNRQHRSEKEVCTLVRKSLAHSRGN